MGRMERGNNVSVASGNCPLGLSCIAFFSTPQIGGERYGNIERREGRGRGEME